MGDNTVFGLVSTGKEEARATCDKCTICGWGYVKKRGWDGSAIKSDMLPVGAAEIVDTFHRLRIV